MSDAVETYLQELRDLHLCGAAVPETSYYPALSNLLNEVGKPLKVRCIINPASQGSGIPDGGFYTKDQFPKSGPVPPAGVKPARGVLEVKPPAQNVAEVAGGEQVLRYLEGYRQVLVTNLWEFALVGYDRHGVATVLERYRLADNESDFWAATAHLRTMAKAQGRRLVDFLERVILRPAPLVSPQDVARWLASYAREALARIELGGSLRALEQLRTSLEEALGLKFEGDKGEHFFRSTLIQTLFYGVFSAWVLWPEQGAPGESFNWHETPWYLHVPMINALYHQISDPAQLSGLGLVEVMDWAEEVLNRVERKAFFANFEENHAVQYFYEPFLEAFDPVLRKELGVWYTPPEIVEYMVARVDRVLREELDLPDGLADERVVVLDPCCGTGAYLVETLRRIERTLREKGEDGLVAADLKKAAQERVFGFEILPAPFVVSHLQLGLLLQRLGAPLGAEGERVGVYLTNALTGWEPPQGPKVRLPLVEFEEERDAADEVKQEKKILVILGNPPYNGFAGVAVEEERDLSTAYRTTKRAPAPQGQGLNDLYVRFFRMAERRIVEKTGQGVVCFISNYSWLDGLSFTGMRERYIEVFDRIWVDCLNGDKYKTGKLTPWGESDPSVFSTDSHPTGIQVGTTVSLLLRKKDHSASPSVRYRDLWGVNKRDELAVGAEDGDLSDLYRSVVPSLGLGLALTPLASAANYGDWPTIEDLLPVSFPGIKTSRDDFVVDIDRGALESRLGAYFDAGVSNEEMRAICPRAMTDAARFDAAKTRSILLRRGMARGGIVPFGYRPFDVRWLYWEPETKLLDEKRKEYFASVSESNPMIAAVQQNRKECDPPMVCARACSLHLIERGVSMFPLLAKAGSAPTGLFGEPQVAKANLSERAAAYLSAEGEGPAELFHHVVAVLHSPAYRAENAGALRQDWPRIPLPKGREGLEASAELGRRVAALLDTENPVPGVTCGELRSDLRAFGAVVRVGGGALDPTAGDLAVTAGWGHAGQGGVTMPGKGKLVEGPDGYDVYLNERAYWARVPARVWNYTIGGYQVIKKWLSYRERALLGRDLTVEEAKYVRDMVRRIAALVALEPELDENYRTVKSATYCWR